MKIQDVFPIKGKPYVRNCRKGQDIERINTQLAFRLQRTLKVLLLTGVKQKAQPTTQAPNASYLIACPELPVNDANATYIESDELFYNPETQRLEKVIDETEVYYADWQGEPPLAVEMESITPEEIQNGRFRAADSFDWQTEKPILLWEQHLDKTDRVAVELSCLIRCLEPNQGSFWWMKTQTEGA